jgi:hypothetical protein
LLSTWYKCNDAAAGHAQCCDGSKSVMQVLIVNEDRRWTESCPIKSTRLWFVSTVRWYLHLCIYEISVCDACYITDRSQKCVPRLLLHRPSPTIYDLLFAHCQV